MPKPFVSLFVYIYLTPRGGVPPGWGPQPCEHPAAAEPAEAAQGSGAVAAAQTCRRHVRYRCH